ncbi:MAG: 6-carboxytetrahydropterin synthase [Euryarchaeota archaeon]|nr:6-carboxytetrahydropterin synthase [Euryarchaeota archaeon]
MQLRIDGWRSGVRFAASHIIPRHETCGRLHGHTYALHVMLEGEPGPDGFIMDFNIVKAALRRVADSLDHKLLLPALDRTMPVTKAGGSLSFEIGEKKYMVPAADVELLPIPRSSAENLSGFVLESLLKEVDFPSNVKRVEVGVDEGYGKGAFSGRSLH